MSSAHAWQPFLTVAVIAVVMLLRMRRLKRARRMRLGRLLIAPVILAFLVIYLFASLPPDTAGIAIFAGGLVLGAALGWQRARWMKVAYDPVSGNFTLHQSPLAIILLIGIMLLRRLVMLGASSMTGHGAALLSRGSWLIDGLIGFGLGMVAAQNSELWLRARAARAKALADTFA